MTIKIIILLALALALDSFAIAMGMGLSCTRRSRFFAFVAIVAVMHILFPLVGLAIGNVSAAYIGRAAAYAGGGLLVFLSLRILLPLFIPKLKEKDKEKNEVVLDGYWSLIVVALSVSMDALSVGFSLGVVDFVWYAPLVFGFTAGLFTVMGYIFGRLIGLKFRDWAEILAAIILLVIGIKIMIGV